MEFSRRDLLKASLALSLWPMGLKSATPVASAPVESPPAVAPPFRRYGWRGRRKCSSACIGPYSDAVLIPGEPPAIQPGSFTVAVLPDTQHYSDSHPDTFLAQTEWIAETQRDRNIACVLHLGDVTDQNTSREWQNAVQAMQVLDGKVPYFMVPGNHDYSDRGECTNRDCRLSEYFPVSHFQRQGTLGGVYDQEPDRIENSFHLFEAGGRKLLALCLEFGPRRDVIRWANQVVAANAERGVMLVTHAYAYHDDTRYDWRSRGSRQFWNPHSYDMASNTGNDVTDGEELWQQLVSLHKNFLLTINGHVLGNGLGRVTSSTSGGPDITQLLVNFQVRPRGGDGWLRLLEFRPNGQIVQVYDYSPTRHQRNASQKNEFAFRLPEVMNS